jgi:hypothetical protein
MTVKEDGQLWNSGTSDVRVFIEQRYAPLVIAPGEQVSIGAFMGMADDEPGIWELVVSLSDIFETSTANLVVRSSDVHVPILTGTAPVFLPASGGPLSLDIAKGTPPFRIVLKVGGNTVVELEQPSRSVSLTVPAASAPFALLSITDAGQNGAEYLMFLRDLPPEPPAYEHDMAAVLAAAQTALDALKVDGGASRVAMLARMKAAGKYSEGAARLAEGLASGTIDWEILLD